MSTVSEYTVHVLYQGFALCRFSDRVPLYWPENHRWTGPLEAKIMTPDVMEPGHKLCETCMQKIDQVKWSWQK